VVVRISPPAAAIDSTRFVGSLTGGSFLVFTVRFTRVCGARTCGRVAGRNVTAGVVVSAGGEVELELNVDVDEPWDEEYVFCAACEPGAASAWMVAWAGDGDGSGLGP